MKADKNYLVKCKCGCGEKFMRLDNKYRIREYVWGHHNLEMLKANAHKPGQTPWNKGIKTGHIPWNKGISVFVGKKNPFYGKKHSEETKQLLSIKVSEKLKGKTPKNIEILKLSGSKFRYIKGQLAGEKHHNWKGGITPISAKIRASEEYKEWRSEIFKRDDYTCVKCNKVGGDLVADHIKAFAYHPELRLNIDNGRTLCRECNFESTLILREWAVTVPQKGGVAL